MTEKEEHTMDANRQAPRPTPATQFWSPPDTEGLYRLLTVEQAAEHLGTPTRFIRRLIAERRIRFCRVGRYVRIAGKDLSDFIEAGRVEPVHDTSSRPDWS
jgi:excisionase family DNA binding protein